MPSRQLAADLAALVEGPAELWEAVCLGDHQPAQLEHARLHDQPKPATRELS
jgi:hypothetical protein